MRLDHLLRRVSRVLDAIIDGLAWIGAGSIATMVLVVVVNVVGRYLFRKPLLGAVEMVGLLTVVVVFCVLAFTESKRAHIVVDILLSRLHGRTKTMLVSVMCFLGGVFFIITGWQGWDLMWSNLFPIIRATGVLSIPFNRMGACLDLTDLDLSNEVFRYLDAKRAPVAGYEMASDGLVLSL